jgi:hypothetical protein
MNTKSTTRGAARAKKVATKARITDAKLNAAGVKTRMKGHLKASVSRQQAKKDSRNA